MIKKMLFVFIPMLFLLPFTSVKAASAVPDSWGRCVNAVDGSLHLCDTDAKPLPFTLPVTASPSVEYFYSYLVNIPSTIEPGTKFISYDFTIHVGYNQGGSRLFSIFGKLGDNLTENWVEVANCTDLVNLSIWNYATGTNTCNLSIRYNSDTMSEGADIKVIGSVEFSNPLNSTSNGFRLRLGRYNTTGVTTSNSMIRTSNSYNDFYWEFTSFNYTTSTSVDLGPLINQNQTIIDQNNQTNNKLDNIDNSINSDNVDDFSDTINSFEGFLDENSTITKLVTLPVTLYSSILNNINSTCSPFNLGTLYGEALILPCINVGDYLGSTLWGMIDLIISGFAIYSISKKFIKIFNNFSTLKEGDILDD